MLVPPARPTDTPAFQELKAKWSNRHPGPDDALRKAVIECKTRALKRYGEELDTTLDHIESLTQARLNTVTPFLNHIKDREKRYDKQIKKLILDKRRLLVR